MINLIESKILESLPTAEVYVMDPHNDGEHFQAIVIASEFANLSLVKQHQLVMNTLRDEFKEKVHALALKTFTPEKWDQVKDQFPLAK